MTLTIAEKDNCSKKCEFEFSVIGYCYEMINNGGIAALGLSTEKQQDMKYFLNSLCYYNTYANKYFQNHQYIKDNETNKWCITNEVFLQTVNTRNRQFKKAKKVLVWLPLD